MKYTEKLNLKKPELTDYVNIGDLNENMDILDEEVGNLKEGSTAIEGLQTKNKTLSGAINEVKTEIDKKETPAGAQAKANAVQQDLDAHKAEKVQHLSYAIASGTNTYNTTIDGISSLVEGMSVKVKFTNANTGASTLNINSLGVKSIKKANGNELSSGNIKAGQILHLVYTGSVFQLLGEGGEYGTAQASDVLSGKTVGTEEGIITGTMLNRGAISNTITTQGGQITIPKGYHNGSGVVKAQLSNLYASNIVEGFTVGGVRGTFKLQSLAKISVGSALHLRTHTFDFVPTAAIGILTNNYGATYWDRSFIIWGFPWSGRKLIYIGSSDAYITSIKRDWKTLVFEFEDGISGNADFIVLG